MDLYTENGQTLQGSFSAVSKPQFASKYSLELAICWKALAEIYTKHSFAAPLSKLNFLFENRYKVCQNFAKFVKLSLEFVDFRADFYRNFTKSCRINKNYQIFAENCENL